MKGETLNDIAKEIEVCRKCGLYKNSGRPVPGEGPADAKLMLVGQNPGVNESLTGRPFVGRSGQFLNQVLESVGLDRKKIFITSIVKHKSPNNRTPTVEEIDACRPYLVKQIQALNPRIVVLMGKVALETPRIGNITYVETCHPAAALRFPRYKKQFIEDFRRIKFLLKDS